MKSILIFLAFSVVLRGFAAESISHDASSKPASRAQLSLKTLEDIPVDVLEDAIWIAEEGNGEITLGVQETENGALARTQIRNGLEGSRIMDLLVESMGKLVNGERVGEKTVEINVYNRTQNKWEKKPISLAAIIATALSKPTHDVFAGRRLFVQDRNGDKISITVGSDDKFQEIKMLKHMLNKQHEALTKSAAGPIKLTSKIGDDEPAKQGLAWNETAQSYELLDHDVYPKWVARNEVKKVIGNRNFASKLEQAAKSDLALEHDEFMKKFLGRADVRALTHSAMVNADPGAVRQELSDAVHRYRDWTPNPNDPKYYNVSYTRLAPQQQVVPVAGPDQPVIAFSYPDAGAAAIRLEAARAKGADEVYTSSNAAQAAPATRALYEKTKKKLVVFFGGHGNGGFLHGCTPGPELDQFISETRGMVSAIYLLGCNVGDGVENPNLKHAARDIAVKSKDPDLKVYSVDQYLMRNSAGWFLSNGGNLVTVSAKGAPQVNVESLMPETTVWEEAR